MADSMCGPSNAGKGLVNHFDRNRSIQQDRFVNSSPGHNSASFRSTLHQAGTPGAEAVFNAFQSQTPSSSSFLPPTQIPGLPLNIQSARPPRSHPAAMASPPSWVQDFQKSGLGSPTTRQAPSIAPDITSEEAINAAFAHFNAAGSPAPAQQGFAGPYVAAGTMTQTPPSPYIHHFPDNRHFQAAQQEPAGGRQYMHYPQDLAIAADSDEALEAAFAAYDQDFEHEMHQWMDVHGPQPGETFDMAEVEATMKEIADEQDFNNMLNERAGSPTARNDDGATTEFRKAAMDILDTVGKNEGEKFKNSSFLELMRRICAKEVVLQGDDLVDTKTGAVLGTDTIDDATKNLDSEETAAQAHADSSGKGKDVAQD